MIGDRVAHSCPFQVRPGGQARPTCLLHANATSSRKLLYAREGPAASARATCFRAPESLGGLVKGLPRHSCPCGLERQAFLNHSARCSGKLRVNSNPLTSCYHNASHTGKQPLVKSVRVLAP
ncbi:hypothetical protein HJG60_008940 [Phyllostomus discolor]|uniref:Uncharacterized protein n=1 Tax=Phyllostomus discolor TaxID=89673 RepID=A0A834DJB9_9CHIR|nr:hypothetical protein HJG60_008940 [Phyllostomus discolor]